MKNNLYALVGSAIFSVAAWGAGDQLLLSKNLQIDLQIQDCRGADKVARQRGECAYNVYKSNGQETIFNVKDCVVTNKAVVDINKCQAVLKKQLDTKDEENSAVKAPKPVEVPMGSTLNDATTTYQVASKERLTETIAQAKVNDIGGNSWYVTFLALGMLLLSLAVAFLFIKLHAVGSNLPETEARFKRLESSELADEVAGNGVSLKKLEDDMVTLKTRLANVYKSSSQADSEYITVGGQVAQTTRVVDAGAPAMRPGDLVSALTEAVKKFSSHNVPLSPTKAREQILKNVSSEPLADWFKNKALDFRLANAEHGNVENNGQLLAIGGVNRSDWLIYPKPLSEAVLQFTLWFDGDVTAGSVTATTPAVAHLQGDIFVLKRKGTLG